MLALLCERAWSVLAQQVAYEGWEPLGLASGTCLLQMVVWYLLKSLFWSSKSSISFNYTNQQLFQQMIMFWAVQVLSCPASSNVFQDSTSSRCKALQADLAEPLHQDALLQTSNVAFTWFILIKHCGFQDHQNRIFARLILNWMKMNDVMMLSLSLFKPC